MELEIKTVSFGGYDKKATETYVLEQQKHYEDEIAKLKADATKLSEAVKGLQQMREANVTESQNTIDNLRGVNEDLQRELESMKIELDSYKTREQESASRYESISRTLLSARETADDLTAKTKEECERKTAETNAQCKAMIDDTNARCEQLKAATEQECDRLLSETQSSCQEKRETTFAECESLKKKTKEETDALSAETEARCAELSSQTQSACERLKEDTITECERQKATSREEINTNRALVKKEFDTISGFMAQLQASLVNVTEAVDETQRIANSAFSDAKAAE